MGNLKNACIAFLVPFPSLIFFLTFLHRYDSAISTSAAAGDLWEWCACHPLLLANLLFFANVDVLFWIIGLLQSNHWVSSSLHFLSRSATRDANLVPVGLLSR